MSEVTLSFLCYLLRDWDLRSLRYPVEKLNKEVIWPDWLRYPAWSDEQLHQYRIYCLLWPADCTMDTCDTCWPSSYSTLQLGDSNGQQVHVKVFEGLKLFLYFKLFTLDENCINFPPDVWPFNVEYANKINRKLKEVALPVSVPLELPYCKGGLGLHCKSAGQGWTLYKVGNHSRP